MIYIVHWKDVVGPKTLDAFLRVQKELLRKDSPDTIDKFSADIAAMYRTKRLMMRRCGYEQIGPIVHWYGWFDAYEEGFGDRAEIKFRTTAPPHREYISLSQWMEWFTGAEQDAYERQYYGNVAETAFKAAADADFVPEEDDAS